MSISHSIHPCLRHSLHLWRASHQRWAWPYSHSHVSSFLSTQVVPLVTYDRGYLLSPAGMKSGDIPQVTNSQTEPPSYLESRSLWICGRNQFRSSMSLGGRTVTFRVTESRHREPFEWNHLLLSSIYHLQLVDSLWGQWNQFSCHSSDSLVWMELTQKDSWVLVLTHFF